MLWPLSLLSLSSCVAVYCRYCLNRRCCYCYRCCHMQLSVAIVIFFVNVVLVVVVSVVFIQFSASLFLSLSSFAVIVPVVQFYCRFRRHRFLCFHSVFNVVASVVVFTRSLRCLRLLSFFLLLLLSLPLPFSL